MREDIFADAMQVIYATFGRASPVGMPLSVIRDRVRHIPDEAVPWITQQICDEERLPANMGRTFARGWDAWQAAHPERLRTIRCEYCDCGYLHCWRQDGNGKWAHFVSPCPRCAVRDVPVPDTRELQGRGVVVMPGGYRGGPLLFDRERGFGVLWPLEARDGAGTQMRRVAQDLPQMRTDRKRLRSLTEAELADVAG